MLQNSSLFSPQDRFFPSASDGKESACDAGDPGSTPELERSPGGGHGKPTPGFLPEESHGPRSPGCYSPWGRKELQMTEQLPLS